MLSIRIVTVGAVVWILAIGGAAAQTATTAPGQPIPLLQILTQPDKTKTKLHTKRMSRTAGKTHLALAKGKPGRPMRAAAAAAREATDAAAPTDVAAMVPVLDTRPAFTQPDPSELVVGGRTVQVVSPDDANELDLAADVHNAAPATPMPRDAAEAKPALETAAVAPAQPDASPAGSPSWIAQALAALGGAVAAGSVAWFLIGATPQRTYG